MKAIKEFGIRRFATFTVLATLGCTTLALAITNGTLDTVHSYTGAIIAPNKFGFTGFTGGNGLISCTGTLVSPRVVLTAGHCVYDFMVFGVGPGDLHVDFDWANVYTYPNSSWRNVTSYALMPGFQVTSSSTPDTNDIGVIILASPLNDITPAQLAPVGFLDNYPALNMATTSILGYGLNEQLVFTGNRLFTTSYVINLNDTWLKRSDTPGGICAFDSGGPTLLVKGTTEYQVGVHSSGTGNTGRGGTVNGCGENSYDTRVETVAVQSFIQQQIAGNP